MAPSHRRPVPTAFEWPRKVVLSALMAGLVTAGPVAQAVAATAPADPQGAETSEQAQKPETSGEPEPSEQTGKSEETEKSEETGKSPEEPAEKPATAPSPTPSAAPEDRAAAADYRYALTTAPVSGAPGDTVTPTFTLTPQGSEPIPAGGVKLSLYGKLELPGFGNTMKIADLNASGNWRTENGALVNVDPITGPVTITTKVDIPPGFSPGSYNSALGVIAAGGVQTQVVRSINLTVTRTAFTMTTSTPTAELEPGDDWTWLEFTITPDHAITGRTELWIEKSGGSNLQLELTRGEQPVQSPDWSGDLTNMRMVAENLPAKPSVFRVKVRAEEIDQDGDYTVTAKLNPNWHGQETTVRIPVKVRSANVTVTGDPADRIVERGERTELTLNLDSRPSALETEFTVNSFGTQLNGMSVPGGWSGDATGDYEIFTRPSLDGTAQRFALPVTVPADAGLRSEIRLVGTPEQFSKVIEDQPILTDGGRDGESKVTVGTVPVSVTAPGGPVHTGVGAATAVPFTVTPERATGRPTKVKFNTALSLAGFTMPNGWTWDAAAKTATAASLDGSPVTFNVPVATTEAVAGQTLPVSAEVWRTDDEAGSKKTAAGSVVVDAVQKTAVNLTGTAGAVTAGNTGSVTFTVASAEAAAGPVVFTPKAPAGTTIKDVAAPGWVWDATAGTLTSSTGLAANGSVTVTVTTDVDEYAPAGPLTFTGELTGDHVTTTGATADLTVTAVPHAELSISAGPAPVDVEQGDAVRTPFTLTTDVDDDKPVSVVFSTDAGMKLDTVELPDASWTYDATTRTATAAKAVHGSVVFTAVSTVTDTTTPGTKHNVTAALTHQGDRRTEDNSATVEFESPALGLALQAVESRKPVVAGEGGELRYFLKSAGGTRQPAKVAFTPPAGVAVEDVTVSAGWTYDPATRTATAPRLAANSHALFTVKVKSAPDAVTGDLTVRAEVPGQTPLTVTSSVEIRQVDAKVTAGTVTPALAEPGDTVAMPFEVGADLPSGRPMKVTFTPQAGLTVDSIQAPLNWTRSGNTFTSPGTTRGRTAFTVHTKLSDTAIVNSSLHLTAAVEVADDPNTADNTVESGVFVQGSGLTLSTITPDTEVQPGTDTVVEFTTTNANATRKATEVAFTAPTGFTVKGVEVPSGWTYDASTGKATAATLAAAGSGTFRVTLHAGAGAVAGPVTATATGATTSPDTIAGTHLTVARITPTVTGGNGSAAIGGSGTVTFEITSPVADGGPVSLRLSAPDVIDVTKGEAQGWTWDPATKTLTNPAGLPAGGSTTVTFTLTATASAVVSSYATNAVLTGANLAEARGVAYLNVTATPVADVKMTAGSSTPALTEVGDKVETPFTLTADATDDKPLSVVFGVDAGLTLDEVRLPATGGWTYDAATRTASSAGAVQGDVTFTAVATVKDATKHTVTATARHTDEGNTADNTATAEFTPSVVGITLAPKQPSYPLVSGVATPVVFEFGHDAPTDKPTTVSFAVPAGYTLGRVTAPAGWTYDARTHTATTASLEHPSTGWFEVEVTPAADAAPGQVTATATHPVQGEVTATANVEVMQVDLAVTAGPVTPVTAEPGGRVAMQFTVHTSVDGARPEKVTFAPAAGITVDSVDAPAGWTGSGTSYERPSSVKGSATFTVHATVSGTAALGSTPAVTAVGEVAGDPDTSNNSATGTVTVHAELTPVEKAIADKADAIGAAVLGAPDGGDRLGRPVGGVRPIAGGHAQRYAQGGAIVHTDAGSTVFMPQKVLDTWQGDPVLLRNMGAPVQDAETLQNPWSGLQGTRTGFSWGAMYDSPRGTVGVNGLIGDKFHALDGARGPLGFPVSSEQDAGRPGVNPGRVSYFEAGGVYWTQSTGKVEGVNGEIFRKYQELGEAAGNLGFPVESEGDAGRGGRVSRFQSGGLYWSPSTGAHGVNGLIYDKYKQLGEATGPLGFPRASEADAGWGGRVSHFESGGAYWHPAAGTHTVNGLIYDKYKQLGEGRGRLGFPVSSEEDAWGGGRQNRFQYGMLIWRPGQGVNG